MKLYNTLSRKIEEFTPRELGKVKMYTCGLTVYSHPQIGNWVSYIYSDILTRTLRASGYAVERVQNITDVGHLVSDDDTGEDKMEKGARAEGITAWDVAEKYIKIAKNEGFAKLGLMKPTLIRATELIDEQIVFVQQLEEKNYTYVIPNEGVYFDTSKLPDYGKLARLDIKGLDAGARVAVGGKKLPTDFALWKFSPKNSNRDMEWDSPWGKGFPGWHLECSVIARENLGDHIDIHTGGIDHIPVHHTNEIAQTETLTGKKFVNYWFHNNFMKVNGTKLSKSLGNSYTLNDIESKGFSINAFKLLVLSSHYRTEGNFTWEIMLAAQNRLNHWLGIADQRWQVIQVEDFVNASDLPDLASDRDQFEQTHPLTVEATKLRESILQSLQNDLDTPTALKSIDAMMDLIDKHGMTAYLLPPFTKMLQDIQNLLGIDLFQDDITAPQKKLIAQREAVRAEKDWSGSDALRDTLLKNKILVKDTARGTVWSRLR